MIFFVHTGISTVRIVTLLFLFVALVPCPCTVHISFHPDLSGVRSLEKSNMDWKAQDTWLRASTKLFLWSHPKISSNMSCVLPNEYDVLWSGLWSWAERNITFAQHGVLLLGYRAAVTCYHKENYILLKLVLNLNYFK